MIVLHKEVTLFQNYPLKNKEERKTIINEYIDVLGREEKHLFVDERLIEASGAWDNIELLESLIEKGDCSSINGRHKGLNKYMDSITQKVLTLSEDVIKLARNSLVVNLRFMDKSISMLKPLAIPLLGGVSVDGESIGFDPIFVLSSYKRAKELPVRQYLHMVFHCVFQHAFVNSLVNEKLWNLACDIAVENMINELNLSCVAMSHSLKQRQEVEKIKKKVKYVTAEVIYRYLLNAQLEENEIERLREIFFMDDHFIWYERATKISLKAISQNNEESDNNGEESDDSASMKNEAGVSMSGLQEDWKKASESMQMDLETFSKNRGDMAGDFVQNLKAVNREKYDYTSFLKKFATLGEAMKINDDEFDYIFYTYGLKLYKKMPLIEPLEYKEVKRIKEFVIAIDTSGSTSGELVQTFLQKTYNILKQQETFFTKINLHIIQCDADIQEDTKITGQDEFDNYIKTMTIKGLGGTDFRPVFKYVDELIHDKEFTNLKGMIYFTDGFGEFPNMAPEYNTAFVYINEGYENPEVPVWAIKLVLEPEDIKEIKYDEY